jgi:SIR2-like domain
MLVRHDPGVRQICGVASVGRLVPFVGAGLSRPMCRNWASFLDELNRHLGVKVDRVSPATQDDLYRIADRAAFALRFLPVEGRRARIRAALLDTSVPQQIPPQSISLAHGYWPLLITTNYDDVMLAALQAAHSGSSALPHSDIQLSENTGHVSLLGRAQADCEKILRSLDVYQPRIIWHIQGYVGKVVPLGMPRYHGRCDEDALLEQLVIGHQQYQRAANQNQSFRRAFAEVFRRRSLLFIGSGIKEGYFVNLISEIILNFGPSPQQHFALFSEEELEEIDAEFLEVRLGITPVCYGKDYAVLPKTLSEISMATLYTDSQRSLYPTARPVSMSFAIPRGRGAPEDDVELSFRFARLRDAQDGECVVLSVGLDPAERGFSAKLGVQAISFLQDWYRDVAIPSADGQLDCKPITSRLFRLIHDSRELPIFLLGARDVATGEADRRTLIAIRDATSEALGAIEELTEFKTVFMGLMAAGDPKFGHPMFSLIAQLSGIRKFAVSEPRGESLVRQVEIRIIDRNVVAPILEGRLPIQELLSSSSVRVLIHVLDDFDRTEAYTVTVSADATVGDALSAYRVFAEDIDVQASPLPHPSYPNVTKAPVFPTMTITVRPRSGVGS